MANMSYCMFENTSNDLRDCVNAMEEACDLADLDLSESELQALKYMRTYCELFLRAADSLLDVESDSDGQKWQDFREIHDDR